INVCLSTKPWITSKSVLLKNSRRAGIISGDVILAIDVLDEVRSFKPQKVTRNCHHPRSMEAAHTQNSSGHNSLQKDLHEGISFSSRQPSVDVSDKSRPSSACVNGSCESMNSRVSNKNSFSSGRDICVIDKENSHPSSRPSTLGNDMLLLWMKGGKIVFMMERVIR
ncbi:hypothetical protein FRX31_022715, partial [Thalictrum thalictroides]